MLFSCSKCGTRYQLPDDQVANRVLKVRCTSCQAIVIVRDPSLRHASEQRWFVAVAGQQRGPMGLDDLGRLVRERAMDEKSFVWCAGMAAWSKAADVPELAGLFARTVPPPLPPPGPKTDLHAEALKRAEARRKAEEAASADARRVAEEAARADAEKKAEEAAAKAREAEQRAAEAEAARRAEEAARLAAEAEAARKLEEARQAEAARVAAEAEAARQAEEAQRAEEARVAAEAEAARQAEEARVAAEAQAEAARQAEEAEAARQAAEAEAARQAAEAEAARQAEEAARLEAEIEAARRAEEARAAEAERLAAAAREAEEAALAEVAKAEEAAAAARKALEEAKKGAPPPIPELPGDAAETPAIPPIPPLPSFSLAETQISSADDVEAAINMPIEQAKSLLAAETPPIAPVSLEQPAAEPLEDVIASLGESPETGAPSSDLFAAPVASDATGPSFSGAELDFFSRPVAPPVSLTIPHEDVFAAFDAPSKEDKDFFKEQMKAAPQTPHRERKPTRAEMKAYKQEFSVVATLESHKRRSWLIGAIGAGLIAALATGIIIYKMDTNDMPTAGEDGDVVAVRNMYAVPVEETPEEAPGAEVTEAGTPVDPGATKRPKHHGNGAKHATGATVKVDDGDGATRKTSLLSEKEKAEADRKETFRTMSAKDYRALTTDDLGKGETKVDFDPFAAAKKAEAEAEEKKAAMADDRNVEVAKAFGKKKTQLARCTDNTQERVKLVFTLLPNGRVSEVEIQNTKSDAKAACLEKILKQAVFPAGPDTATYSQTLIL